MARFLAGKKSVFYAECQTLRAGLPPLFPLAKERSEFCATKKTKKREASLLEVRKGLSLSGALAVCVKNLFFASQNPCREASFKRSAFSFPQGCVKR
ncbi:hypothetical protein [Mitsuokella multacida]|uniref:hypothetical protein n=1 Tax=Mitsuokella TaxID=52225 RepID=UPI0011C453DC